MDFKAEILKFNEKSFEETAMKNRENTSNEENFSQVESTLKTEIRKSSLILQSKLDSLQKEISNLNLENDNLKKQIFRGERELKGITSTLFDTLDVYLPLVTLLKGTTSEEVINLMEKKVNLILQKNNITRTATIGDKFNYQYHEALNENLPEKAEYVIKEIISQGYIKDGKVIKIAKVMVE